MKTAFISLVAVLAFSVSTAYAGGRYGRVEAYSTVTYTAYFAGGYSHAVQVIGDGDTDLDVYVYDEYGYLVEQDDDWTDDCFVSWYQYRSGTYTIVIKNLGDVYNRFWIGTY